MGNNGMRWVEKLNIVTGLILVIVGIIHFFGRLYPTGFSWFIFGSMYLVMDSYQPASAEKKFQQRTMLIRKTFSVIGFAASAVLLIYTIL